MINILLLILKIIGIVLLAVLGIILLLVLIILFVPVRYQATLHGNGSLDSLKVKGKVSWLLRLLQVDLIFKDTVLKWRIRIAWKKMMGGQKYGKNKCEPEKEGAEHSDKKEEKEDCSGFSGNAGATIEPKDKNPEEEFHIEEIIPKEESVTDGVDFAVRSEDSDTILENAKSANAKRHEENSKDYSDSKPGFDEKIEKIIEKVKCTFQSLYAKIEIINEKKDKLVDLLADEIHLRALLKLKQTGFKALRKMKPKKLEAEGAIGFSNPQYAGYFLAVYSVLHPYVNEHVDIQVDFTKELIKGTAEVKGNVRASVFVGAGIKLLLNKNVRRTIKDVKEFKL